MRCLVAFDKFKDALSARRACETAAATLRERHHDWTLDLCPLTDGGEGFAEILTLAGEGRLELSEVTGPRGRQIPAPIGYVEATRIPLPARKHLPTGVSASHVGSDLGPTSHPGSAQAPTLHRGEVRNSAAIIGLASASGLELLPRDQRDPWKTTTFGTGELVARANAKKTGAIVLGVGGSATNDLGLGALAALGFRFFAANGTPVAVPTPDTWERIVRIEPVVLDLPPIFIACDVTNPLLGPRGATATFGPQKGLAPADVPKLEAQMSRMAALLCDACGRPLTLADVPGTGATGGFPFGLMVGAGAAIVPGSALVSAWLDLPARLAAADLVITGEGRFDATSLAGKGPGSLVREARRLGKPAHVFAGSVDLPALSGVEGHAITPAGMPLAEALPRTAELLAAAVAKM
ncbi:MAG TPA: glycerate kinase [Lacunisphaera sp.]|nr:glycerate kinase [Lacunisphaera sp.]